MADTLKALIVSKAGLDPRDLGSAETAVAGQRFQEILVQAGDVTLYRLTFEGNRTVHGCQYFGLLAGAQLAPEVGRQFDHQRDISFGQTLASFCGAFQRRRGPEITRPLDLGDVCAALGALR